MLGELRGVASTVTARGATLVWSTLPCTGHELAAALYMPSPEMFEPARVAQMNSRLIPRLLEAAPEQPAANQPMVLDLFGLVCPGGRFSSVLGPATAARPDGVHFSRAGARWVADQLGGDLEAIARRAAARRARARGPS